MRSKRVLVLSVIVLGAALFGLFLLGGEGDGFAQGWSGTWRTGWRDGGALLVLEQSGNRVTGSYSPYEGRIEGGVTGPDLTGRWIQKERSGEFTFTLGRDGRTFSGRFANGEWWTGKRVSGESAEGGVTLRRSTPRETCRSFLLAMERAREGRPEEYETALACLEAGSPDALPGERIRQARALFDVLDRLTFRIWRLPEPEGEREVTATLGQSGTEVEFELRMRLGPDGSWLISTPDLDELDVKVEELEAARRSDGRRAHPAPPLASPRATLRTFLSGVEQWDRQGRDAVISTMAHPDAEGALFGMEAWLLADSLQHVLGRTGTLLWQEIPDNPAYPGAYVHYSHPRGVVELVPVTEDEHTVWRFSPRTLRDVVPLFLAIENADPSALGVTGPTEGQPLFFRLRSWAGELSPRLLEHPLGIANFQVLGLLTILLIGVVLALVITRLARLVAALRAGAEREGPEPDRSGRLLWPLGVLIGAGCSLWLVPHLGLPLSFLELLLLGLHLVLAAAGTVTVHQLVVVIGDAFLEQAQRTSGFMDEILVSLTCGVLRLVILCAGLFVIADLLALPYQSVLAGLGIGGLALAIAAKDTLANFFGSIVLLTDRPFLRGDLVSVGGYTGTVEHVGIRSTRIRTLADSQVIVPNAQLANEKIDNRGRRRARLMRTQVSVTYGTPPEKLEEFAERLRERLEEDHPHRPGERYVGVLEFGSSSVELEILCYLSASSLRDEREARHRLLLDIHRLASELGVEFAFPTRTVYLQGEGEEPVVAPVPTQANP